MSRGEDARARAQVAGCRLRAATGVHAEDRSRPGSSPLRRQPGGVVLLSASATPAAPTPLAGDPARPWTPSTSLPDVEPDSRRVDIFYTPHPDDETLSMGVLIADDVRRGDRVIVVALTDGRTTGAVHDINARLHAARPGSAVGVSGGLTQQQIADARIEELRRATADLGVAARDVFLAHLDAPGSDCGPVVSVAEAGHVIAAFAARFPNATHVTMSDVAERQEDHLDAGVALHQALSHGMVRSAEWTVSRLWWQLPSPAWSWHVPDPVTAAEIRAAADAYQTWDPARAEYAVGWYSVRWQFAALEQDPRDRVHSAGPLAPGFTAPS